MVPAVNVDALRVAVAVAVADSRKALEAAHSLVYRRYRSRGYEIDVHWHDRPRAEADGASHRKVTIVAAAAEGMIGTCTLGFDGPNGLRAEATYGEVIRAARAAGS